MKKSFKFVAIATVAALTFAACNNNANTETADTLATVEQLAQEEPVMDIVEATPDTVAPAPAATTTKKTTTTTKKNTTPKVEERTAVQNTEQQKAPEVNVDSKTTVKKSDKKIERVNF